MIKMPQDFIKYIQDTDGTTSVKGTASIEKATIKKVSKAINTGWLASDVTPTNTPSIHRIHILVTTDTVVNLQVNDGTNTTTMKLNAGAVLSADCLYAFDITMISGYSYNVQHETTTQDVHSWIEELGVL